MSNQSSSFRRACIEFAMTLLLVVVAALVAGYVAGSLGASREVGLAAALICAAMVSAWWRKRCMARQARRPG